MERKNWSEVYIDMIHLENVREFKYLECVLDESGKDRAECSRKVVNGRKFADAIRICRLSVLESCMKHCLYMILCIGSKTMLWKEKRSRNKAAQMDNLRFVRYKENG